MVAALSYRRTHGFAEQHLNRAADLRVTAHRDAERTTIPSNPKDTIVLFDGRCAAELFE